MFTIFTVNGPHVLYPTRRRTAMRSTDVFVLGIITGAVVLWIWRREIGSYAGEIQAIEEKTVSVLDRTKEHVGEALRAGQEAIRPAREA
jgi:hypothetical protein